VQAGWFFGEFPQKLKADNRLRINHLGSSSSGKRQNLLLGK
jgi:hypothetical protein